MDGTYGFVYSGAIGVGIGVFTVNDGVLSGSDGGNVNYKGRVTIDTLTGQWIVTFEQFIPAGVLLVQGTSALDYNSTRPREITVPPNFGDGQPVTVNLPPGQVTLMAKRVPDDFAPFAAGFTISPITA